MDAAGEAEPSDELLLCETDDRRLAFDWALVLDAERQRCRLWHAPLPEAPGSEAPPPVAGADAPPGPEGPAGSAPRLYRLFVPAAELQRARALLDAWEEENRPQRAAPEPAAFEGPRPGLLFAVLCLATQLATGTRDDGSVLFAKGSADASRLLHGDWFRAATALTLHQDLSHALGNAASGWFLLGAVAARVGPAWASWLSLVAGVAGNLATAAVVRHGHDSIGASTAVFGALGTLTGLQLVSRRRRGWITVGAGVALLGLLGTGEHSDLLAHLFGFLAGLLLGLPVGRLQRRAPADGAWVRLLALLALAPLALAWTVAIR